jgi:UDP-glucose 4-epimerase
MTSLDDYRLRRLHRQPHRLGASGTGHNLVVLDNVANSSTQSLSHVLELAGPDASLGFAVVAGDIRNPANLKRAFSAYPTSLLKS